MFLDCDTKDNQFYISLPLVFQDLLRVLGITSVTTQFTSSYEFMYIWVKILYKWVRNDGGNDLPCSVCRSTVQSSILMILLNHLVTMDGACCTTGTLWRKIVLMNQKPICLDEHSEAMVGGQRSDGGKLFSL